MRNTKLVVSAVLFIAVFCFVGITMINSNSISTLPVSSNLSIDQMKALSGGAPLYFEDYVCLYQQVSSGCDGQGCQKFSFYACTQPMPDHQCWHLDGYQLYCRCTSGEWHWDFVCTSN